jgi:hypothetical protein
LAGGSQVPLPGPSEVKASLDLLFVQWVWRMLAYETNGASIQIPRGVDLQPEVCQGGDGDINDERGVGQEAAPG